MPSFHVAPLFLAMGSEEGVNSTIPMSRDPGFRKGKGTGGLLGLTGLEGQDLPSFRALRGR